MVAHQLSRLTGAGDSSGETKIKGTFPYDQLLAIKALTEEDEKPWFANIANYVACGIQPTDMNKQQLKQFLYERKFYFLNDLLLYKI